MMTSRFKGGTGSREGNRFLHMSEREKTNRAKTESVVLSLQENFEKDFKRGSFAFRILSRTVKMNGERLGRGLGRVWDFGKETKYLRTLQPYSNKFLKFVRLHLIRLHII